MSTTKKYKYPLQMPESLKETATRLAEEDGVSLNQWIVSAIAQKIGAIETAEAFLEQRGKETPRGTLSHYLRKARDEEPASTDEVR